MDRSGIVDVCGSPWDRCKNDGWSHWVDKHLGMVSEYTQGTEEHIWPSWTVSILSDLELGIRSVMFPTGYGYITDETFRSWQTCLLKVHEWCPKSSDQKSQWKPFELTSQNGFWHIRHLGTISGSSVPKMGIWYHIGDLVPFWRLGTISGILALSLEYRSWNFDTCSRGRSSLKVISTWRVTYD